MSTRGAALAILALALAAPLAAPARADYVRDEIRINMRSGPGTQYRIIKVLKSGDVVERIGRNGDWVNVDTPDGDRGWVPEGYLTTSLPPSLRVPELEAKLARAERLVEELRAQLGDQSNAVEEVAALRARNAELEQRNQVLVASALWKSLGMGALIALGGLVIGVLIPRGRPPRTRRIKL